MTDVEYSTFAGFSEHKGYAENSKTMKSTGQNFSQQGHRVSDMRVRNIETQTCMQEYASATGVFEPCK